MPGILIIKERFSMLFIEKRSRHIWSPMLLMFQAYIVPFIINVPGIYGPLHNQRSRHIWSPLESMFQAYLIPIMTDVPFIIAPPYKLSLFRKL